jgi:hypothetical protein
MEDDGDSELKLSAEAILALATSGGGGDCSALCSKIKRLARKNKKKMAVYGYCFCLATYSSIALCPSIWQPALSTT